ncbi:electron transport complex subunit RsxE [Azotosporobacter soli]|uniref:electron transport complex subunit RsxE n=1 Tax=Azotosporobacter soli TaxID=3055040 RepID=UPI0031FE977D
MNLWQIFIKGVFEQNPIFRLALSLCPALAVTSTAMNATAMGVAVLFVITANNMVVSVFRKLVNPKVRVPVYITSIATIVTVVQLVMEAYTPLLYKELSIYLALIVVFAIILARAEVFAAKNSIVPSMFDGLGMGAGFALAMILVGMIRELFGSGSIYGMQLLGASYDPALIMILPPGGFILIGLMIGSFNIIGAYQDRMKAEKAKGGVA